MIRVLFVIVFLIQAVLPSEDLFLIDSLDSDVQLLLDYDKRSKKIKSKEAQVNFFSETSFLIYNKTLNLKNDTRALISQYNLLINDLEQGLGINNTSISYDLGAPLIETHFKQISIDRKTLKNNLHYKQVESLKDQYLKLARYRTDIVHICESRVDELLSLLDENSLDNLFNNSVIDKNIIVMSFDNISDNKKYDKLISTFPDIIINRYKHRDDISVTYSGSIEPDLRKIISHNQSVRFLIDGSFIIDGYDIKVNFKVYDINDWSVKTNQNLSCDIRDIDCVYDNFLWNIKQSVDPLILFEEYDDFSEPIKGKEILNRNKVDSLYNKKDENNSSKFSCIN